jgi:anti-sigma factor RsiW
MSREKECSTILPLLAGYQGGWLTEDERAQVQTHLESCPSCVQELRLEERMPLLLAELPEETPRAVSWAQVYATHPRAAHPMRRLWRPAMAFAAATAFLLLIISVVRQGIVPAPVEPPLPATSDVQALESETATYASAHLMVSAGDGIGDPNRAIILMSAAQSVVEER